jgi:hypothetical protein
MSNSIYLFKEHENFQLGSTQLKVYSVYNPFSYQILLGFSILVMLYLFWTGLNPFYQAFQFSQSGMETIATVVECQHEILTDIETGHEYTNAIVTYRLLADTVSFTAELEFIERLCYTIESSFPVYYLSNNPQDSRIGSFVNMAMWLVGIIRLSIIFPVLLASHYIWKKYLLFRIRCKKLQDASILLSAHVTKIFLHWHDLNNSKKASANYEFVTPTGHTIKNQIHGNRIYTWPQNIHEGDTLHILYVNDETFCVL